MADKQLCEEGHMYIQTRLQRANASNDAVLQQRHQRRARLEEDDDQSRAGPTCAIFTLAGVGGAVK